MDNQKKLEKYYNLGLKLEKAGDFDGAEKAYLQALEYDPHDHGGISIRLASMKRLKAPETAPKAYIATLFDQHAEQFDDILVDQLGYQVPLDLRDQLIECTDGRIFKSMLDLGCGTGLGADALDDVAKTKIGVDLSENMVAIAHEKGDYNRLFVADAVQFVQDWQEHNFDLIIATDVLPYMGKLDDFFAGVSRCLEPKGIFGFSSETLPDSAFEDQGYCVGAYQRFAHKRDYVEACLDKYTMRLLDVRDIVVRSEQGQPVQGHLYLAEKSG